MLSQDFFARPPKEATRWIVRRHTAPLVDQCLKDLDEYSLKNNLKEKTLAQIYNLVLCVEGEIAPHCDRLLKNVVYRHVLDEEPALAGRAVKIAELLGLHVAPDFLLPMLVAHLQD